MRICLENWTPAEKMNPSKYFEPRKKREKHFFSAKILFSLKQSKLYYFKKKSDSEHFTF